MSNYEKTKYDVRFKGTVRIEDELEYREETWLGVYMSHVLDIVEQAEIDGYVTFDLSVTKSVVGGVIREE